MTISSSMATFWDSGTFGRGAFNRRNICSIFSLIADTVEACALAILAQYFQKVAGSWCQWTGSSTVDGCSCARTRVRGIMQTWVVETLLQFHVPWLRVRVRPCLWRQYSCISVSSFAFHFKASSALFIPLASKLKRLVFGSSTSSISLSSSDSSRGTERLESACPG